MVQKYTLPFLIILVLLSWVAIVYNEVFLKGAGQTIEIKEVAKKPLLISVLMVGVYEKIYQLFYWIVAKIIGNKKYEFGDIQQHTIKYEIHQKGGKGSGLQVAAKLRPIGFNRNKEDNQNGNNSINNSIGNPGVSNEYTGVSNEVKSDNLTDSNVKNYSNNDNRITKIVTVEKVTAKSDNRTCKNCNEYYVHKHHKQLYCTTDCKIKHWEKKNGKKLRFKAKK
jgi:hypothetical protein